MTAIMAQVAAVWFGARAAMQVGRDIRAAVFSRVLSFSSRELNQFGAPSLITRTTNDVQQVQQLVLMTMVMMVSAPITMVGGVIMAVREDAGMSWLILAAVALLGGGVVLLISRVTPLFQAMQQRIDAMNRVLREQITGIRVVRAFVREPHEERRFREANEQLTDVALSTGRWMAAISSKADACVSCVSMSVSLIVSSSCVTACRRRSHPPPCPPARAGGDGCSRWS